MAVDIITIVRKTNLRRSDEMMITTAWVEVKTVAVPVMTIANEQSTHSTRSEWIA